MFFQLFGFKLMLIARHYLTTPAAHSNSKIYAPHTHIRIIEDESEELF